MPASPSEPPRSPGSRDFTLLILLPHSLGSKAGACRGPTAEDPDGLVPERFQLVTAAALRAIRHLGPGEAPLPPKDGPPAQAGQGPLVQKHGPGLQALAGGHKQRQREPGVVGHAGPGPAAGQEQHLHGGRSPQYQRPPRVHREAQHLPGLQRALAPGPAAPEAQEARGIRRHVDEVARALLRGDLRGEGRHGVGAAPEVGRQQLLAHKLAVVSRAQAAVARQHRHRALGNHQRPGQVDLALHLHHLEGLQADGQRSARRVTQAAQAHGARRRQLHAGSLRAGHHCELLVPVLGLQHRRDHGVASAQLLAGEHQGRVQGAQSRVHRQHGHQVRRRYLDGPETHGRAAQLHARGQPHALRSPGLQAQLLSEGGPARLHGHQRGHLLPSLDCPLRRGHVQAEVGRCRAPVLQEGGEEAVAQGAPSGRP
ncbi:uncharacterized protein LOC130459011 [Monodelphis domestica]|uniref:uncharacterized protein LOC130459011 n=1 Tax=Monodelphis domestica TaxID=13616 RepID=UPI0024E1CC0D|nr:uncharacterized protein LOC130459011 [Monodelphis domestica]